MKILTLGLALFLGCAHAKDPGSAANLVQSMKGKKPKDMCSDGTWSVTLRSYSGKYCNDKSVCDMMKSNCFPGGSDPYKALQSGCAKMCIKTFGKNYFTSTDSHIPELKKDYATLDLAPGATCTDLKTSYRKLALKNHPDKGGGEEKFKEISTAFDRLKKELSC